MTESLRGPGTQQPELPLFVTLRCEVCDDPFTIKRSLYLSGSRTCSRACGYERRKRASRVTLVCDGCGVGFWRYRSEIRGRKQFHSRQCRSDYRSRNKQPAYIATRSQTERNWERYQNDTEYRERRKADARNYHRQRREQEIAAQRLSREVMEL